jgi:hypothetical protein
MARSQIIRSPSTGMTRRTTIGKEWIVICQMDEAAKCDMLTFKNEATARRVNDSLYRAFRPDVHYVERAEVSA